MNKISSFRADHTKIREGVYLARIDGDMTTYDLRTRIPNAGDYMSDLTMHSVEHMLATFFRNSSMQDQIIYFGPMGCQTGFYLLVRNAEHEKVMALILDVLEKTVRYEGEIFGCSEIECGNYRNLSLDAAKKEAARYLEILKKRPDLQYYEEGAE